jgi:hypothetical protein
MSDLTPFEREQCLRIIEKLINTELYGLFVKLDIQGSDDWQKEYRRLIPRPMDLQTVRADLQANRYRSLQDFSTAVDLIWTNSIKFNGEDSYFASIALQGQAKFRRAFAKICRTREEEWLRKLIRTAQQLRETARKLSKRVLREARKEGEYSSGAP